MCVHMCLWERFTVSQSSHVHILSSWWWEVKTWTERTWNQTTRWDQTRQANHHTHTHTHTIGSEWGQQRSSDELLHRSIHPSLSIDHPRRLRKLPRKLIIPTCRAEQKDLTSSHLCLSLVLQISNTWTVGCYLLWRQMCGDMWCPGLYI